MTRVRDAVAHLGYRDDDAVTQFEVLTAAAFVAVAAAGLDLFVVEAGLGGRFDATNVLDGGAVTVLTNISREHTELLGETEGEIAGEKLAVAPDGSDRLVVGRLDAPAVDAVARDHGGTPPVRVVPRPRDSRWRRSRWVPHRGRWRRLPGSVHRRGRPVPAGQPGRRARRRATVSRTPA